MRVAYVGTRFSGWQKQPRKETIQGCLEAAFGQVLGHRVGVTGAGRTDAGVHAAAQQAHVVVPAGQPTDSLCVAVNALIPREIRVIGLRRSRPGFHARRDAQGKTYHYRLSIVRKTSPFDAPFVGRLTGAVPEVEMMRQAAARLTGEHDFSCFCGSGSAVRTSRRRIERLDVVRRREEIRFIVEGDGFLRHQVRNMVGTLIEVGQGRRTAGSMTALLRGRDRRAAGPTAPASGLCLMRVRYGRRARRSRRS